MKIFKLIFAEFKKIFFKPIMILAFFAVIVSLVLSTITFNPIPKEKSSVIVTGQNLQIAFETFADGTEDYSKNILDNKLELKKDWFVEYVNKIESETEILTLKEHITKTNTCILLLKEYVPKYYVNDTDTPVDEEQIKNLFSDLKSNAEKTHEYIDKSLRTDLSFYITIEDFDALLAYYNNLHNEIPDTFPEPEKLFKELNNFIQSNYDNKKISPIVQKLKTFNLDKEKANSLLDTYYTKIHGTPFYDQNTVLDKLYKEIFDFVNNSQDSTLPEDFEKLSNMVSNYKSIVNMSINALETGLKIETAGDKPDSELQNYIGFSNYNGYTYKQEFSKIEYLIKNNDYDYNYLSTFSYKMNSGEKTNGFDFVVYSMQILCFVLSIFLIFVSSSTVASELSSGTMKMLAIRPYNRRKIISAKFISCLALMFVLLLMGFAISSIVGFATYGIDVINVLAVFNGTKVIVLNGFVLLLLYFLSCMINLTFIISITLLVSVLTKSSIISVIFGVLIYGFSLISNALLYKKSWFIYTPFAHFDLFKYFGAQVNTGSFFDFALGINANFTISIIYLLALIFVSIVVSVLVFQKRNIA